MTTRDEGVIKFNCYWTQTDPLPESELRDLIDYRNQLFKLGFIGVYPDGIGYGNISQMDRTKNQFVISGTQTGHFAQALPEHFASVTDYNIKENSIICEGPIKASSESLTHAMIYETFPDVTAVIHIHSPVHWKKLMHQVPTTRADIPYGTPQMADEIKRLSKESDLPHSQILVMAGHEDGIISFGSNLDQAFQVLQTNLF